MNSIPWMKLAIRKKGCWQTMWNINAAECRRKRTISALNSQLSPNIFWKLQEVRIKRPDLQCLVSCRMFGASPSKLTPVHNLSCATVKTLLIFHGNDRKSVPRDLWGGGVGGFHVLICSASISTMEVSHLIIAVCIEVNVITVVFNSNRMGIFPHTLTLNSWAPNEKL